MMDALEQARREIDTVDAQLAALFERRMKDRKSTRLNSSHRL